MNPDATTGRRSVSAWMIHDSTVYFVIMLNVLVLFLDAFPGIHASLAGVLFWVDYGCLIFFILEAFLKIRAEGSFRKYWQEAWNKLDFIVVAVGWPLLGTPFLEGELDNFSFVLLLRLSRFFRLLRTVRYVPEAARIWGDMLRALRVSIGVFLALFVLNVILSMGANIFFGSLPEAQPYFGDPFKSFYSMFKVFTVEGWYEIPERLALAGVSSSYLFWLRLYFVISVLLGGLMGFSIANAIFVDFLVSDNTDKVEGMVRDLQQELQEFREEMRQSERGP